MGILCRKVRHPRSHTGMIRRQSGQSFIQQFATRLIWSNVRNASARRLLLLIAPSNAERTFQRHCHPTVFDAFGLVSCTNATLEYAAAHNDLREVFNREDIVLRCINYDKPLILNIDFSNWGLGVALQG